jgi:hypothetical protein
MQMGGSARLWHQRPPWLNLPRKIVPFHSPVGKHFASQTDPLLGRRPKSGVNIVGSLSQSTFVLSFGDHGEFLNSPAGSTIRPIVEILMRSNELLMRKWGAGKHG